LEESILKTDSDIILDIVLNNEDREFMKKVLAKVYNRGFRNGKECVQYEHVG